MILTKAEKNELLKALRRIENRIGNTEPVTMSRVWLDIRSIRKNVIESKTAYVIEELEKMKELLDKS